MDLNLTEIDYMLGKAQRYADELDREYNRSSPSGSDMQALSAASRAWSALASTHLQRLATVRLAEQADEMRAERERVVAAAEALANDGGDRQ